MYSYGLKQMYPDAKRIRQIWHYLAFNKEIVLERTEQEIKDARKKVLEVISEIEQCREWPARLSKLCDWCEFKPLCPKWSHLYKLEDKPAEEYLEDSGVKLVNKLAEISEEIDNLKEKKEKVREALINFAKKNNVEMVFGSGVKASIRHYPRMSYPKKTDPLRGEFFATLKKIGLWDQLAIADVYELTKMINRKEIHQELVELLEKFIERKEVDVVSLRKST
jgi:putative RecB family exonuclease